MSQLELEFDEDSDAKARRSIAEELNVSLLVEAAAGTGKTTCLVNRIVNSLESGLCQPSEIAAVTFTRKAAAELQERILAELRHRLQRGEVSPTAREGLQAACHDIGNAFIGTIHSFCAKLLSERPIEFGVAPQFQELEEAQDQKLMQEAWHQTITRLKSERAPCLEKLEELGVEPDAVRGCFERFVEYRDVELWPNAPSQSLDVEGLREQVREYVAHMKTMTRDFPEERGNDKLMAHYETIVRGSQRNLSGPRAFWRFLTYFDRSAKEVQKQWPSAKLAKQERDRYKDFREHVVQPALQWLREHRYSYVIEIVREAVSTHQQLKHISSSLDFTDLLLLVAAGLREQPALRRYFQRQYRRILVDEFQDTDPIQAELLLLLTSDDPNEKNWRQCRPIAGSLFVVGDPKQSIYRFRRGDIQTYRQVKSCFESHGRVLALQKNFRSEAQLIEWNNTTFRKLFPAEANDRSPAYVSMQPARTAKVADSLETPPLLGLAKLSVTPLGRGDLGYARSEAAKIATFIQTALDQKWKVARSPQEIESGRPAHVTPGDFLLLPWQKRAIGIYRQALEKAGVPCDVSGMNSFGEVAELELLVLCLQAIDDPNNPIPYLAICRERLFGFSDAELYQFKSSGGRFRYTSPVPESLPEELRARIESLNERLRQYQRWLRTFPFVTAALRIAEDVGLLALAAQSPRGDIVAGSMWKALETIRQHSHELDATADLISNLQDLLSQPESESATAHSPETDVVRVMNLHKAKGLEAPVVFLCDSAGLRDRPVTAHIDRFQDERGEHAVGYMCIRDELTAQQRKLNETHNYKRYRPQLVAAPSGWAALEQAEQAFLKAESERLLYVATTRAASMLVVCNGADRSPWAPLIPSLENAVELGELLEAADQPSESQTNPTQPAIVENMDANVAESSGNLVASKEDWEQLLVPSFETKSAKKIALAGSARPKWEATGDFGYRWGTVLHDVMDISIRQPQADLRLAALRLCAENGIETSRLEELLQTVQAVRNSDLWARASRASRMFSEMPFEYLLQTEDKPILLRGVIDLLFEEPDGWVLVDYKTDDIQPNDLASAKQYYWPQVKTYAKYWSELAGVKTKEAGLYFTRVQSYASERIA